MEGHEILGKVKKVGAPPDFEERVFYGLREARKERARRRATFRYALAGAAALLLAGYVMIDRGLPQKGIFPWFAGKDAAMGTDRLETQDPSSLREREEAGRPLVPVLETVDYAGEFRHSSHEPRTVYILEQVSDVRTSGITY